MENTPSVKQRLKAGHTVVGSWLNSASPIIAELMAQCGFDFITVDAEHSAVDLAEAQKLFQAIKSGNSATESFVRLPGVDYATTKRYLDAGASGIIAPLVLNSLQATELVRACKYPPEGKRGVGFCRANDYGLKTVEHFEHANNDTLVVVQIEDIQSVHEIDSIFSVPGIDAAFIGPYDLSASMGLTAQFDHPDFVEARDRILAACKRHGVIPGIHVVAPDPDEAIKRHGEGYRFIAFSLDITMVQLTAKSGLQKVRSATNTK